MVGICSAGECSGMNQLEINHGRERLNASGILHF
jgi:hypothetical protein